MKIEISNKDEAARAKEIAEKKMKDNDFISAMKFALKAQKLDSGLENISQMLAVCHVHCSAAHKMIRTKTMDWYTILELRKGTTNEAAIKKQYKKLALILHPDKNRFPGAEAAFKLVGEAHEVLSAHVKHVANTNTSPPYNMSKTQQEGYDYPPYKKSKTQHEGYDYPPTTIPTLHQKRQQQRHHCQYKQSKGYWVVGSKNKGFWTACPHCNARYKYLKDFAGKPRFCESCDQHFILCDIQIGKQPQFQPQSQSQSGPQFQPQQQQQQQLFWTSCTNCGTKNQFNRNYLNKARRCEFCKKEFIEVPV